MAPRRRVTFLQCHWPIPDAVVLTWTVEAPYGETVAEVRWTRSFAGREVASALDALVDAALDP